MSSHVSACAQVSAAHFSDSRNLFNHDESKREEKADEKSNTNLPLLPSNLQANDITIGSDDLDVQKMLATVITPRMKNIITQIALSPNLLDVAALQDHPFVSELIFALEAFGKQFSFVEQQFKPVLEKYARDSLEAMGERREVVYNTISSVIHLALKSAKIQKKEDDCCVSCVIC